MTREEAIQYLKDSYAIGNDEDSRHHNEVMDYLISALSAEGEYIKKEDLFAKTIDKNKAWLCTTNAEGKNLKEIVEDLPSYSIPEREKGEWIESTYQFCGRTFSCIRCSNCDSPQDYFRTTNFCPNCGADMRGEDK